LLGPQDVTVSALVGEGGFGQVFKGTLHQTTTVAIKIAKGQHNISKDQALMNELRFLRRVRNPHIVLLHGALVDTHAGTLSLVLEWVDGVMLHYFLKERKVGDGHEMLLALGITTGMHYLHAQSPPILHHDLKPANVMIETVCFPPKAKILDFGLSALLETRCRSGTRKFMAPEIIHGRPHGPPADVFAFGCILLLVFARLPPPAYPEAEAHALIGWPIDLEPKVRELTNRCLLVEPTERPNMREILQIFNEFKEKMDENGISAVHTTPGTGISPGSPGTPGAPATPGAHGVLGTPGTAGGRTPATPPTPATPAGAATPAGEAALGGAGTPDRAATPVGVAMSGTGTSGDGISGSQTPSTLASH